MSKKLVLIVVLLAAMAAAGAFLLNGGRNAAPSAAPAAAGDAGEGAALAAEPPRLGETAAAPSDAAARTALEPEPAGPADLDPSLRAALAGFTGRLLHHDKTPAAGARVALFQFRMEGFFAGLTADLLAEESADPAVDGGEATTADDGRFRIAGVWPRGIYLLHANIGGDDATARVVESSPAPGETVDLGDIVLNDGAVLTGTVVDSDGAPIAGARVAALDLPSPFLQMVPIQRFDPEGAILAKERSTTFVVPMPAWVKRRFDQLPLPMTHTGADGTFRLGGVPTGSPTVVVNARGFPVHTTAAATLKAGQVRDLGKIELDEGEEARGKVVDSAGQPVAGAEVLVGQAGAVGRVYFALPFGPTDDKGRFTAVGLAAGKAVAAARRSAGDPWVMSEPESLMRELVVTLPASHTLTVRLESAKGLAIEEPRFRLLASTPDGGALELARLGFNQGIDLAPRLQRREDGRFAFVDLPAGRYLLLVRAPGHAVAGERLEIAGNADKTIRLEPAAALTVRVHDGGGEPVRAAAVFIDVRETPRLADMPLPCGRTSGDGTVVVSDLRAGEARVTVTHPAFGSVHVECKVPGETTLAFDAPGAIEGVLTEHGRAPELGKWTIALNRSGDGRHAMPEMPGLTVPDAEGRFRFAALQPGDYEVTALATLSSLNSPGKLFELGTRFGFADSRETRATVRSGQTTAVSLDAADPAQAVVDGPSARVSGTAFIDGRPATGMTLWGWGENHQARGQVDDAGRFDLGQVPEGDLYLNLRDNAIETFGSGHMWSRSFKIEANKDREIAIELVTATVAGRVVNADGAAVSGAEIDMNGQQAIEIDIDSQQKQEHDVSSMHYGTITDAEGAFELKRVTQGRYDVRATHDEEGLGTLRGVDVRGGVGASGLVLAMRKGVSIKGRVDMAALGGKPPQWMWIGLEDADGNHQDTRGGQVDDEGNFEIAQLQPGTYRARAWASFEEDAAGQEYAHDGDLVVGADGLSGVVLQFKPRERHEQRER